MKLSENIEHRYKAFEIAQKDAQIKDISNQLYWVFLDWLKHPYKESSENKESSETKPNKLTIQDLWTIPQMGSDEDWYTFLQWLFKNNHEYVRDGFIDFDMLNEKLDRAARYSLWHWLGLSFFRTHLKDFCNVEKDEESEQWKIWFNIKSLENYNKLIKTLTDIWKDKVAFSDFVENDKKGLFLKNLCAVGDLTNSGVYNSKLSLFDYTIDHIFKKFFQCTICKNTKTDENTWEHTNTAHQSEIYKTYCDKTYRYTLDGNTKKSFSLINKIRRDSKYSETEKINDMIRFQITAKNEEEMDLILEDFKKFYKKNYFHTFQVDDDGVKEIDKSNNNGYRDKKLIIPALIRWKRFNIELKFVTEKWKETNEEWFYNHNVLKLKQAIILKSRDIKYLDKKWILEQCKKVVHDNPTLYDEISPSDKNKTIDLLFEHILKCLIKTEPENDKSQIVISKEIFNNLKDSGYWIDVKSQPEVQW